MRFLGDFDGLDAPGSWFLDQRFMQQVTGHLTNKTKELILSILIFEGVHMLTILSTPYMDTPKIMPLSRSCCVHDLDLW